MKKQPPDQIQVFGRKYQVKPRFHPQQKAGVKIEGDHLIINPTNPKPELALSELNRFLKTTATKYITTRTAQLAAKMKTNFNRITIRQQKTRWGSCSSKQNLNFNWRLVHFPPQVIDYVIIHELAHLKEMNHSTRFWQLVRTFDPDFPKHKGYLKRNGIQLD